MREAFRRGMRRRLARRGDDGGSVLVMAVLVSLLVAAATTTALVTSSGSVGETGSYTRGTSARLDAESGIQQAILQMRTATSWSALPSCSATVDPMALGSATVSVAYDDGGTSLCPLSGPPPETMAAVVTSIGTVGASSVEIQAHVTLDALTQPQAAFDYAVYTPQDVSLDSDAVIQAGSSTALPDVYAGGTLQCTNANSIAGNVEETGSLTLSSGCTIAGTLYADDGSLQLTNTTSVGKVELFGGPLSMNSNATIVGDAYVSGGDVTMSNPTVTIGGDLGTTGSISFNGGSPSSIHGTTCSGKASCIPPGTAMPSAPPFPELTEPSAWPAGTDVIDVPSSSCSTYFAFGYPGGSGPVASPFTLAVDASTAPLTVVEAPTCDVTLPGTSSTPCTPGGISTETLGTNLVLFAKSVQDYGCVVFRSASASPRDVAIVVPYGDGTGQLSFTNTTDFTSSINLLLYTPGEIQFSCQGTMTGQLIAGGEVYTTNQFTMTASDAASTLIPSALEPWSETVAVQSENLLKD